VDYTEIINKISAIRALSKTNLGICDEIMVLSDEVGALIGVDPIKPDISFDTPKRVGKIISNANANIFSWYSGQEFFEDGKRRMWYLWQQINANLSKTNSFISCISDTGLSGDWHSANVQFRPNNPNQGVGGFTSTKFKGNYYHWKNGQPLQQRLKKILLKSPDGINWTEYQTFEDIWEGEDSSFCVINPGKVNEKLIMFSRPFMPGHPEANGMRHINIRRSLDGINWTPSQRIFTAMNPDNQYYSMSVCEVSENTYYGVLNVFNKGRETVHMEVVTSKDLINWTSGVVIPRDVFIKMQFGGVSYDPYKKQVNILVLESENDHAGNGNPNNRFYLALYTVNVNGV